MAKPLVTEILTEGLDDHPAVLAWRHLHGNSAKPRNIEIVKRKRKSTVYRLNGIRPGGASVIAKKCAQATGLVEQMVYEELLPCVPGRYLRCCGLFEEPMSGLCWLFLEDAVGELYSPQNPHHRSLAGRWLGNLHLAAVPVSLKARLPARNLGHYFQLLQHCRVTFQDHLAKNSALLPEDTAVLQKFLAQCDLIDAHWAEIEAIHEEVPRALVHGDFVTKNVRIQEGAAGPVLLVFDWELSGWGVPGTDLAQFVDRVMSPDLGAYCEVLKREHPKLDIREIERVAACGNLLRLVDDFVWATSLLEFGSRLFLVKAIDTLQVYESSLAQGLGFFGWITND